MTDLPKEPDERRNTFAEVIWLKAEHQHQKQESLRVWRIWYIALTDEARSDIDEQLKVYCEKIRVQFGKSVRFKPRNKGE
ncbi:hypothetical protein HF209_16785 [Pseudomonas sp. WS 5096]|uniref:Uncharacterized protein n=1 Tax=Pseudomonas cremoris TaxID=2724178 RepID=A0ABR6T9W5_9PSED|nr:hypothetical protein [Pseudomonas cremoris]MBC2382600.1 hypothetical protein [Pseudomonas cremoris]